MFDCKRSTTDPLLRLMLKEHHLHVLQWPRDGILPGELVIEKKGGRTFRAPLSAVFSGNMIDAVRKRGPLSDIEETFSGKFDARLGIKLLERVVTLFGSNSGHLESAYDSAATVAVRVGMGEWLDCDPAKLSDFIISAQMNERQGVFSEGDRLYVITGVATAMKIEVVAYDKNGATMDAVSETVAAGSVSTGLSVRRVGTAGVSYTGQRPIVFGVELFELESKHGRWTISGVERYVQVRGDDDDDRLPVSEAAFIGDPDAGPAFIEVLDLEER